MLDRQLSRCGRFASSEAGSGSPSASATAIRQLPAVNGTAASAGRRRCGVGGSTKPDLIAIRIPEQRVADTVAVALLRRRLQSTRCDLRQAVVEVVNERCHDRMSGVLRLLFDGKVTVLGKLPDHFGARRDECGGTRQAAVSGHGFSAVAGHGRRHGEASLSPATGARGSQMLERRRLEATSGIEPEYTDLQSAA